MDKNDIMRLKCEIFKNFRRYDTLHDFIINQHKCSIRAIGSKGFTLELPSYVMVWKKERLLQEKGWSSKKIKSNILRMKKRYINVPHNISFKDLDVLLKKNKINPRDVYDF